MKIIPIAVGAYEVNCYVVDAGHGQALVVDPGEDAGTITVTLRQNHLAVAAYLITHGHMDHVSALAEVSRLFPAPILMHPADAVWAFTPLNASMPYYEAPESPGKIAREAADGQQYEDGGLAYEVIATPGHSPGGVCYYFPAQKALFTGDTLFSGSIGRTDLAGGDETRMMHSLRRLTRLPEDTMVYPGHGPATSIGREKRRNPFLKSRE